VAAERLYYRDAFLREFDALVVACEPAGARFAVRLDRTAFYPTSGGQPHDTGRLGEAAVVEVGEDGDGDVVHFTDRAISGTARGAIDWPRRLDHMQQHTGQHLLSAAFIERFGFPTVSFHLGRDLSTIDLAAPSVSAADLAEAERRTNEVVFEDRGVEIGFATAEELAAAGVRKMVEREGPLRVISIAGFDRQPCGGTHVARTGQVGGVLLRKLEKQKGNWRVEFVCGMRAVAAARADFEALTETARRLSCALAEVPAMVGRALEERQASFKERQALEVQLAEFEALTLMATQSRPLAGGGRLLVHIFDGGEAGYLRMLATKLAEQPGVVALLALRSGGHVVFAQSPGLPHDMNSLLREALAAAGGKGGGSRDLAQGSVADPSRVEAVLAAAASRLRT
jgi:alanyl-tRNA synthetase